jgi:hypothetical protein
MLIDDRRSIGFFVRPYALDGQSVGTGFWEYSRLSARWLKVCGQFLANLGEADCHPFEGNLAHISAQLTLASGAALVSFYVRERLVLTSLLQSGISIHEENEVGRMLVESLKRSGPAGIAAAGADAFDEVLTALERPLMTIVPWADPSIATDDHELVRELALHLAGAFFRSAPPTSEAI